MYAIRSYYAAEHALEPGQVYYAETLTHSGFHKFHIEEESLLLVINKERIDALLFDYSEVAACVLSCVEYFKIAS